MPRERALSQDAARLATLSEVNEALAGGSSLRAALQRVLQLLDRRDSVVCGSITLLNPDTGLLHVEAAEGLTPEGRSARYKVGEGVTGRVVESGKPVIVPRASKEPMFLNRARRKNLEQRDISFICAPIKPRKDKKPVGAISIDLPFEKGRDYQGYVRFLDVVTSMIAQAIRVNHLVDAERQRLVDENVHLRDELKQRYDFANIVGTSRPMREVYGQVNQVAGANTTVLVRGESGTGKELIAHAIHYNSRRAKKPFIKVSCAALPDSLIESELFGYEKGAFTGAQNRKKGRFELAEGGTLFLDEIGDLNASTQIKLLRVLQEREFERLGGTQPVKVDVRLIAATNSDVEGAMAAGTFREDLHYRLNVFTIFVPPLRERKTDVLLLADHFLERYAVEHGKPVKRISTPAIDMLMSYHWPGNVRELENALERAVLICDGSVIHAHDLPPSLQTGETSGTVMSLSFAEAVEAYEKDLIEDALKTTRGNRVKAAMLLQSTERIISYKVKKYEIDTGRYRN
ncbi:MAG: sigma-54-dependent Fis family transcriptional regulator [Acidimicrobiaceae bacterium]|nr:sigma-54-dependent Fis family transcriptional regulator [Acidobacteriota bacterium]MBJ83725.1 sigma-54-dependent Fis family transcriptional regulator [Acidimicrobiaceae bacterium]